MKLIYNYVDGGIKSPFILKRETWFAIFRDEQVTAASITPCAQLAVEAGGRGSYRERRTKNQNNKQEQESCCCCDICTQNVLSTHDRSSVASLLHHLLPGSDY